MTTDGRAVRARGIQRRELLLEAAIRVIAERGIAGVSHRAVAAEAGVPTSSTTYFFDSLDHLIAEAVSAAMDQELARLNRLNEAITGDGADSGDLIDRYIELSQEEGERRLAIAQFEMYLLASRRPDLQERVGRIIDATQATAAAAAQARGVTDGSAAAAIVALIDGFALHRIAHPQPGQGASLRRALRALSIGYVALANADADLVSQAADDSPPD